MALSSSKGPNLLGFLFRRRPCQPGKAPGLGELPSSGTARVAICHASKGHIARLLLQLTAPLPFRRMVVYGGETNRSAVLYHSHQSEAVPFEGVISEGSTLRVDFTSEDPSTEAAFNIRFEGNSSVYFVPGCGGDACSTGSSFGSAELCSLNQLIRTLMVTTLA